MSITLTPTADTSYLQDLLEVVPKNGIYLKAAIDRIVPFDFYGVEFTLHVTQTGIPVTFKINRRNNRGLLDTKPPTEIRFIPQHEVSQVRLPLGSGVNDIFVESDLGNIFERIGVAHWATSMFIFGRQVNDNVTIRLEERQDAILSQTGSLLVERFYEDRDLISRVNSLHRLAMRQIIDGSKNAGQTYGLEKLATGLTANTPIFKRVFNEDRWFDDLENVYSVAEEFAGYDTHLWLLDLCTGSFTAAGKYIENFPDVWELNRIEESNIAFRRTSEPEDSFHILRNFEGETGCSVEDLILSQGCFDRIRPFLQALIHMEFKICQALYPLDTRVEVCYALGTRYWDCGWTLDELLGTPVIAHRGKPGDSYPSHGTTDFDSSGEAWPSDGIVTSGLAQVEGYDPEDPTGDGWVGFRTDGRWDFPFGAILDSMAAEVEEYSAEVDCPWPYGAVVTPLDTDRMDVEIDGSIEVTGELTVLVLVPGAPALLVPMGSP